MALEKEKDIQELSNAHLKSLLRTQELAAEKKLDEAARQAKGSEGLRSRLEKELGPEGASEIITGNRKMAELEEKTRNQKTVRSSQKANDKRKGREEKEMDD